MCAIEGGKCIDTSMGLTPLEGWVYLPFGYHKLAWLFHRCKSYACDWLMMNDQLRWCAMMEPELLSIELCCCSPQPRHNAYFSGAPDKLWLPLPALVCMKSLQHAINAEHAASAVAQLFLLHIIHDSCSSHALWQGDLSVAVVLHRLVMGTRCGDLDPAVVLYIQNATGKGPKAMDKLLNKQSGLLGLSGRSDIRAILEDSANSNQQASLAMNVSLAMLQ